MTSMPNYQAAAQQQQAQASAAPAAPVAPNFGAAQQQFAAQRSAMQPQQASMGAPSVMQPPPDTDAVTSQLRAPAPAPSGSFQPLQGDARAQYVSQLNQAQAGMPKTLNESNSLGAPPPGQSPFSALLGQAQAQQQALGAQRSTMAAGPQMQGNPAPRTMAPMGQPQKPIALGAPGMGGFGGGAPMKGVGGGKGAPAPGGAAPRAGGGKAGGVPSQYRSRM